MTVIRGQQLQETRSSLFGGAMGIQGSLVALDRRAEMSATGCTSLDTYDHERHSGNAAARNTARDHLALVQNVGVSGF